MNALSLAFRDPCFNMLHSEYSMKKLREYFAVLTTNLYYGWRNPAATNRGPKRRNTKQRSYKAEFKLIDFMFFQKKEK